MLARISIRHHVNGTRDPLWLFGSYQPLLYAGGLFYAIVPFVGLEHVLTGASPALGLGVVASILGLFLVVRLYERIRDAIALRHEHVESMGRSEPRLQLIGRPAQIMRVIAQSRSPRCFPRLFRTSLRTDQQWVLLGLVLLVAPGLRLFCDVSVETIGVVSLSVVTSLLLQVFFSRTRYRVTRGSLIVEHLQGFSVLRSRSVSLNGASISIDFCQALIAVSVPQGEVALSLSEMGFPHRFAASLIAGACCENEAIALGVTRLP